MGPPLTTSAASNQAMSAATLLRAGAVAGSLSRRLPGAVQPHLAFLNAFTTVQTPTASSHSGSGLASLEAGFLQGGVFSGALKGWGLLPRGVVTVPGLRRHVVTNVVRDEVTEGAERVGKQFEWDPEELRRMNEGKERWLRDRADRWAFDHFNRRLEA